MEHALKKSKRIPNIISKTFQQIDRRTIMIEKMYKQKLSQNIQNIGYIFQIYTITNFKSQISLSFILQIRYQEITIVLYIKIIQMIENHKITFLDTYLKDYIKINNSSSDLSIPSIFMDKKLLQQFYSNMQRKKQSQHTIQGSKLRRAHTPDIGIRRIASAYPHKKNIFCQDRDRNLVKEDRAPEHGDRRLLRSGKISELRNNVIKSIDFNHEKDQLESDTNRKIISQDEITDKNIDEFITAPPDSLEPQQGQIQLQIWPDSETLKDEVQKYRNNEQQKYLTKYRKKVKVRAYGSLDQSRLAEEEGYLQSPAPLKQDKFTINLKRYLQQKRINTLPESRKKEQIENWIGSYYSRNLKTGPGTRVKKEKQLFQRYEEGKKKMETQFRKYNESRKKYRL